MSTGLPAQIIMSDEVAAWWAGLSDQERIIAALATEPPVPPCSVAEKPWKWMEEAYELAQDNAR